MRQAAADIRQRLLVARLPAMPQILLKLIAQCQTEDVGMAALAALIAKDPGMAGKVLGVANSSAYHRGGRPVGLEQALAALGTDTLKTLVISESVFQVFNDFSHAQAADLRAFWRHSLAAAVIAGDIAARMGYAHVEEAYLAGLLHDVGRLALLSAAPEEYAENFLAADDEALCAIEQRTLDITHAEAGAWLAQRWNLDSFLADSLLYHHEPAARLAAAHPLIRIVLLAHLLSSSEAEGAAAMAAGALCGLDAAALAEIGVAASAQVREAAEYLGIDLHGVAPPPPRLDPMQGQLAQEVRDLMLNAQACRPFSRSREEAELLESITRSACLLFAFDDAVMLLSDAGGQALIGVAAGEPRRRLNEFSLALNDGGRLAEAVLLRRPAFIGADGPPPGIAEQQLLRLLGSQAMVGLPLCIGARCLGLIVGATAAWQLPALRQRISFLRAFCSQAAAALDALRGERGAAARQVAEVAADYREATRRALHEVNNPLGIIKNYLGVLGGKLEKQQPVAAELAILHEEIDRVGQLIVGLAELKPSSRGGGADLKRVVRDIARLLRDAEFAAGKVRIVTRIAEPPAEVAASADTLKQILLNLLKNAGEAMPAGGEIQIEVAGPVKLDGHWYASLCVRDDGPGIAPEILATLFEPVASTKGGEHQGLGLNIVHGLVKQARGVITCRSGSTGTRFDMLFPCARESGPAASGASSV